MVVSFLAAPGAALIGDGGQHQLIDPKAILPPDPVANALGAG